MVDIINQVWLGDCLELIDKIPDKSIDFVLTDPPYGITAATWDKVVSFDTFWNKICRVAKSNCVFAIFGCQPFTTKLILSNIKSFRYCWYWYKNQGTNFFHAKRMPIRKIEDICIFGGKIYFPQITDGHVPTNSAKGYSNGNCYHGTNKRDYKGGKTTRFPDNVLRIKCVDNYSRLHPSEKPVELLEYLIKTYTKEENMVLDCFAGSGSTLVAAKNLNRRFLGIEKNLTYYNTICERLRRVEAFNV